MKNEGELLENTESYLARHLAENKSIHDLELLKKARYSRDLRSTWAEIRKVGSY